MDNYQWMQDRLDSWEEHRLTRTMRVLESAQRSHVRWQGREYLMLASNSYLDLCRHPEVVRYAGEVLREYGTGSGGSRLTTGSMVIHEALERELARFKGTEAAITFTSGYVTNLTVLQCLCGAGDIIYSDELNHASIIDGCRLSRAETVIYAHNDMEDLKRQVLSHPGKRGVIVSDAVFSMDGDIVKLPALLDIARENGLLSMIDEAHSTGVLGKTGRGITEYFGLAEKPDILMGTLSKAFGGEGGFVCGREVLIRYLQHRARGFVFSTAPSPVSAAAALRAVRLLEEDPEPVRRLQHNIAFFTACLREQGISARSETAIIPVIIGNEGAAMAAADRLTEEGYFISAIRYPTVARGSARLRVALMSSHREEELRGAACAIARTVREVTS